MNPHYAFIMACLCVILAAALAPIVLSSHPRVRLVLVLPLLLATWLLNAITGGGLRNSFSARVGHRAAKDGGRWEELENVIDAICRWEPNHCARRWCWEATHGGLWGAWVFEWKAAA